MNKNLTRTKLNLVISDPTIFLTDAEKAKKTKATQSFQSSIRSQQPNLFLIHGDNK